MTEETSEKDETGENPVIDGIKKLGGSEEVGQKEKNVLDAPEREEKTEIEKARTRIERKEKTLDDSLKRAEDLQITALDKKIEELKKTEASLDRKNRELKKLIEEAEFHGKSLAGDRVEENKDEEGKRVANDMLRSTGMLPYPEVE